MGVNPQVGVVKGLVICGDKHSTRPTHRPNNAVEWRLEENRVQRSGVPHTFLCGVIVRHQGERFKGEVEVKVTTGVRKWYDRSHAWIMQAWPWGMDDPILFNPAASVGNLALPAGDIDLAKLNEYERRKLTPLVKEF
jgi:hypothetical protein